MKFSAALFSTSANSMTGFSMQQPTSCVPGYIFCARNCSASSLSQDACIIASSSSWYVHHSKPLQFNVCPVGWLVVRSVGRMDGWLLNNCACAHTKKTYDASSSWLLLVTVCKNSEEGKDYGSQKVTFCLVIRTLKCTHSLEFLRKEKKYV